MHHQLFNGNYALYFTWWDKWMGTEFKDYETRHEQLFERKNIVKTSEGLYSLTISAIRQEANDAFTIQFSDVPSMFRDFLAGQHLTIKVMIEGEVLYPGKYTLDKKNSRISELIGRSGGLTPDAYPKGSVLIRSVNRSKSEQSNYTKGYQNLIKQNILAGTPQVIVQSQIEGAVNLRSQLVGIELEKIMDDPGSKYDLLLQDGDTIRIPKLLQTVRVNGEVLFPTIIRYDGSSKFKDYVNAAGGYSDRSQKKKSFVVHSNGSAEGTKSFLFFKSYPRIKPGDEIYIPTKREKERLRAIEFITIGATLVSMLAILATLIK
jgi:protein involved in polysaccharide export with SLBB domain